MSKQTVLAPGHEMRSVDAARSGSRSGSLTLSTLASLSVIQCLTLISTVESLSAQCAPPGQSPFVLTAAAAASAFPDYPCASSAAQQFYYVLRRWFSHWWGLGLQRILFGPSAHPEQTLFLFTVGLPLAYVLALAAFPLIRPGKSVPVWVHQAYWVAAICGGNVLGAIAEWFGHIPDDFFTISKAADIRSPLPMCLARPLFYVVVKVCAPDNQHGPGSVCFSS